MWQVHGFRTKEEAKQYQNEHGGMICWEERTPKTRKLTRIGKDYVCAAQAVNLDTEKYPYMVQTRM